VWIFANEGSISLCLTGPIRLAKRETGLERRPRLCYRSCEKLVSRRALGTLDDFSVEVSPLETATVEQEGRL
jgi:hypothetical protein